MTRPSQLRAIVIPATTDDSVCQQWFYTHEDMLVFLSGRHLFPTPNGIIKDTDKEPVGIWYFAEFSAKYPVNIAEKTSTNYGPYNGLHGYQPNTSGPFGPDIDEVLERNVSMTDEEFDDNDRLENRESQSPLQQYGPSWRGDPRDRESPCNERSLPPVPGDPDFDYR